MSVLFQDGWLSNHKDKGIDKKKKHAIMFKWNYTLANVLHISMCVCVSLWVITQAKQEKKKKTHTHILL